MAAAKTELLPALQIADHLSFPHSPMDNYPKLEEMIMLNSAGILNASAPEGSFGSGEPGEQYDHLTGGKAKALQSILLCGEMCIYFKFECKRGSKIGAISWQTKS